MARVIESWMAKGGYERTIHFGFTKVEAEEAEDGEEMMKALGLG